MKSKWKIYCFWVILAEAVGALSAFLTRDGNKLFQEMAVQPPLSPPAILFPIVWTILYVLMGIGVARISLAGSSIGKRRGLNIFIAQLIMNFFWTLIFFNAQAYGAAFAWLIGLWILIVLMILVFRQVDPLAALLQIPYLLWVTFAAYLNYDVWQLN